MALAVISDKVAKIDHFQMAVSLLFVDGFWWYLHHQKAKSV